MGKKSKLIGTVLLILGIACIGMYFVYGEEKNEFKVTFDSDGGTSVADQIVKKGEKVVKPDDPTKENSEFVEWQLDGVMYVFDNTVTKEMTLKAKWNEILTTTYTATLEGVEYTASVRNGDILTIESFGFPARDGFNIKLYNEAGEEVDLTQVTEGVVLTAQYIEIKTYTVKFDANGGSKVDNITITEGQTVSDPGTSRDGYTLDGWYLGDAKFDFSTPISKDITLKAKWVENGKINVTFMVDDKVYKTVGVKENTKVAKPTDPTKSGHKFVEWQLNGSKYDFNTPVTGELTLVATFEEVTSVTVKFDSDGGSSVSTQTVNYNEKAKAPNNPTRAGYKFVEWQLNGSKYDFGSKVSTNITLKAKWAKLYTVTFDSDGGSNVASQQVAEGEKATKPANPTKSGYTFKGWLLNNSVYDFNTAVTDDITLVAHFEKTATPKPTAEPTSKPESSQEN